ncbi:MAG: ATP/GTP-binding protein [Rhodococcus sp. (in: high G+C Gram-positive bacteria)]|uniref:ATP/GTP-binding protein n=1 Tax=Rhodococcus sp. TaxID=1831 RepID=UPI003BB69988
MPRRNRSQPPRQRGQHPHASAAVRTEHGPAGSDSERFTVRTVPGSRATKSYRCPGCDHEIAAGVAHVVAWPADSPGGADDRRHWHSGCWSGRSTRSPTRRWS